MDIGLKISASAHALLLVALAVGWPFARTNEPMAAETLTVSLVTLDDIQQEGIIEPPEAPSGGEELAALPPPPDLAPDAPTAPPSAPDAPETTEAPQLPSSAPPPPVDRVAPVPVPPTPEDLPTSEIAQDAVTPEPAPEAPVQEVDPQEALEPEAAAPQIVTEATETTEDTIFAPDLSPQPSLRPQPPRLVPDPEPEPDVEIAEPEPEEVVPDAPEDPVAAAIAEALAAGNEAPEAAPARASGPPLTLGERESLRVAVGRCWNFSSLSTDAAKVTVVVAMDMSTDGRPSNLRLLSSSGGSDGAAQQAYETARRAILRCAGEGYTLPADKYEQWRVIEMTFNPERMRRK